MSEAVAQGALTSCYFDSNRYLHLGLSESMPIAVVNHITIRGVTESVIYVSDVGHKLIAKQRSQCQWLDTLAFSATCGAFDAR